VAKAAVTHQTGRIIQASTTHADLVHVRTVLSLSFHGIRRSRPSARRRRR